MDNLEKSYSCFKEATKSQQEKLLKNLYYEIQIIKYSDSMCTVKTIVNAILLVVLGFIAYGEIKWESILAIMVLTTLVLMFFMRKDIRYIEDLRKKQDTDTNKFELSDITKLINKLYSNSDEVTVYTTDTYKIYKVKTMDKESAILYDEYYVRLFYSDSLSLRMIDEYIRRGEMNLNSVKSVYIPDKTYKILKPLIEDNKKDEVQEILEEVYKN